jgi:hypothetical protein
MVAILEEELKYREEISIGMKMPYYLLQLDP